MGQGIAREIEALVVLLGTVLVRVAVRWMCVVSVHRGLGWCASRWKGSSSDFVFTGCLSFCSGHVVDEMDELARHFY